MAESFINRRQSDPDGLDFEGLRAEGIRLIQEVSGEIWTDYNLHDPGVTLLEAVCYALTDLAYRTGFSAADYLATREGKIDFERLALFRPEDIYPCRPTTEADYRKLFLNAIPKVDNVWVTRHSPSLKDGRLGGLYDIHLLLGEHGEQHERDSLKESCVAEIARLYADNRNLCEDIGRIEVIQRVPYSIAGEIEFEGKREPADVLAEVYFACAQFLSPRIAVQSHLDMYRNGSQLEELLSGTFTEFGYIDDDALHPRRVHFSIPDLVGRLDQIDGIKNVMRLVFVDGQGIESDTIAVGEEGALLNAACLRFPSHDSELGIRLYKTGKLYPLTPREVETEYNRLDFKHQALRRRRQRFDWIESVLPTATFQNTSEYYSFQNDFPDAYGLNAYGVPPAAPKERKLQAMQLKAYLFFFEQIMANFLQNVQEIPRLFSLDEDLRRTTFYQLLRNESIPNIEDLYLEDLVGMDLAIAGLTSKYDRFSDRRSRVLDYLLALHGEEFSQASLDQFLSENVDSDNERIRNKIAFLKGVVELNKNRAAAFNYQDLSGASGGRSGLERKLQVLLALQNDGDISDASSIEGRQRGGEQLHVIEHILLRPRADEKHERIAVPDDFYSFRISIIFSGRSARFGDSEFRKLAEETVQKVCPAHIHAKLFWPDATRSESFDHLHAGWLDAMHTKDGSIDRTRSVDTAAGSLIGFLLDLDEVTSR